MHKGTWLLMGLLALPVSASVYEAHDKWPGHSIRGDTDCDDKDDPGFPNCVTQHGVPEPGTLALLLGGMAGLAWSVRRRK